MLKIKYCVCVINLPWDFKYYVYDSNIKYCDLKDFLKAQFVIFRYQKYVKKWYMEMRKWIYLDSNIKYCDLKDLLKAQFVIFRCQNM